MRLFHFISRKLLLKSLAATLAFCAVTLAGHAQAETIRIVAIGASNTSGYAVGAGSAYPAILERLLKAKGYDVVISFPKEGIGSAAEAIALIKGAKNPEGGKKLIDFATSAAMQSKLAENKVNFVPASPDVQTEASLAAVLKGANIFPIDDDYAGANRKRIVDRWVKEVLGAQ